MAATIAQSGGGDREAKVWAAKSKTEKSKKMQLLKEIEQLEQKIAGMDREKSTNLYNKRSDFRKEFCGLEELEFKFNSERRAEKAKLKQQIDKMRGSVRKFQRELKDIKPTPEFVEKLKETMEDIESIINAFKDRQREIYESLMREELTAMQEITALEKRFETWSQVPAIAVDGKTTSRSKPLSSARSVTADLPPEVAAFERFLTQTGGHRGGWDEYDHQTFLKFRNRHKGRSAFINTAYNALPGRTVDDVKKHESWYQEYLSMLDKKKQAIQKWRELKENEKEDLIMKAEEDDEEAAAEQEEKQRLKAQKLEEERLERLEKLNAWKVQKELEKAQEEERRMEEELQKAREKERDRKRQIALKAQVREFAKQKKAEVEVRDRELEMMREIEREEKKRFSAAERARFLERDYRRLEEKQAKEKAKEEAERQKQKKLERLKGQVQVQVARDPSRLYQLTEGWKERQKDTSSGGAVPVMKMPHRAVPSWRSDL
ncbi:coiled-coil domain-containing protein 112-like isoform X2 [Ptychodera flava]|uniref:coiled-coil domain-containing protein 112-like isoform X2 n=1 Tax=Ptychodera flava TaxID=63121 RepID=UPI00396A76A8